MSATNSIADHLRMLGPNAVVYSDTAWAVARKSSTPGQDRWFPDHGSWRRATPLTSDEMVAWSPQWEVLRNA